jgi:RecG-like helicase
MKRNITLLLAMAVMLATALAIRSFAADEKTITGEGMCAMCVLHQGTECQTIIQVKEGDKTVTYYLVNNDVSKAFHKNVCTAKAKVTATGTVKEVNGKMEFTATKIELAKE